jgi:hypothetical protein
VRMHWMCSRISLAMSMLRESRALRVIGDALRCWDGNSVRYTAWLSVRIPYLLSESRLLANKGQENEFNYLGCHDGDVHLARGSRNKEQLVRQQWYQFTGSLVTKGNGF